MEKLQLRDNHCDKAICELIDGIIHELDLLEGNVKIKAQKDTECEDWRTG